MCFYKKTNRSLKIFFFRKKTCPETSTINPPINITTNNRGPASEETEDDIEITEVRRSNWESLSLGESDPFIPDENDEMNIDLILEGTLKNLDRLNLLRKPCLSDSERPPGNEPRPRYPKRNFPKVSYREEEVSSDDDYIYCDDCGEQYEGSCTQHGPLKFMKDKEASRGSRHAWNTCPDYLSVCRSGIRGAGLGIRAERDLNKGYVFGPYKGKIVKSRKKAKDSGYAWEISRGGRVLHYVEGVDPSVSNWMRFVNCAVCEERQNLIAFQYHGQIGYRVYKEVKAYTELLVWYGNEFGEELGIHRTQEEAQLTERVVKKLKHDGGVAPSSSIQKIGYSETSQELSKRMAIKPNCLITPGSPNAPSEVNQEQISQMSKYRKRGIGGRTAENDVGDHSGVAKSKAIGVVAELNVLSTRNKHVSFSDESRVHRKSHACPHCQYKTPKPSYLKCHIDAVHEGKRPYHCQMCDYSASQASHLKRHVHSVHEGIKRYKCRQCDFRASQAYSLRTHVDAVHEGKKPHPCHHCDYRAARASSLRMHVRAVHERIKPHGCRICDYRTAQSQHLQRHMKSVHGGKETPQCRKSK